MRSEMRRKKGAKRALLGVHGEMDAAPERAQVERVARGSRGSAARSPAAVTDSKALRRGTWADAMGIMLAEALADKEGTSIGAVGAPRYGKTTLMQGLVETVMACGLAERVLVHDVKRAGKPQYEGAPCAGIADYIARGEGLERQPVVVWNGPDWVNQPTLNDVCEVAMALHSEGHGVLVVADEIYGATDGYQHFQEQEIEGRLTALFPRFLREGGSQRISTAWTTQIPQELPTACKVLTRCVAQFHLESLAADAATEKFRLDADGPRVLRTLARGEFVLFCQGREWDRTIYGPKMG